MGTQPETIRARNTFDALVNRLLATHRDATIVHAKMFGLPCIKVNGKVCAVLHDTSLVCRLPEGARAKALARSGARLFQPHPSRPPMREWVAIPSTHENEWARFVGEACEYTIKTSPKPRA